jgi:hypothetical protein
MFDHGDQGYHEYRATQGRGSDNNKIGEGWSLLLLVAQLVVTIPFVVFIGAFLYHMFIGR